MYAHLIPSYSLERRGNANGLQLARAGIAKDILHAFRPEDLRDGLAARHDCHGRDAPSSLRESVRMQMSALVTNDCG